MQEYFDFLSDLRNSGQLNMWMAVPYLEIEFDLDKNRAKEIFFHWIEYTRSKA